MIKLKFARRDALLAFSALLLVACSGSDDTGSVKAEDLVDMSMGPSNAPATLVEYASTTCGACAAYHKEMKDTIESLTDEGKLKFIFREFPRSQIDIASFATARCAGEDKYFDVIDDLFTNQQGIVAAARAGTLRTALEAIGMRHGVEKAAFESCLEDETILTAITNASTYGEENGVGETPTLLLNGVKLEYPAGRSPESLTELIGVTASSE